MRRLRLSGVCLVIASAGGLPAWAAPVSDGVWAAEQHGEFTGLPRDCVPWAIRIVVSHGKLSGTINAPGARPLEHAALAADGSFTASAGPLGDHPGDTGTLSIAGRFNGNTFTVTATPHDAPCTAPRTATGKWIGH